MKSVSSGQIFFQNICFDFQKIHIGPLSRNPIWTQHGAFIHLSIPFPLSTEVLSLKLESRILRQSFNPVCSSWKCQASSPYAKQHRGYPVPSWRLEKPKTGYNYCLRILLSCFRNRTSASLPFFASDFPRGNDETHKRYEICDAMRAQACENHVQFEMRIFTDSTCTGWTN